MNGSSALAAESGAMQEIQEKGVGLMKFIMRGKNIDVTPALKETIEHKLGKLERYFTPDTEIHVTLS